MKSKIRAPRVRGLARTRLAQVAARLFDQRLVLVVAPAGSGKTTLLSQFATAADGPVAWYRVESADSSPAHVVAHLERALGDAFDSFPGPWQGIDDAVAAVDSYEGPPALLMVDDLHAVFGSPAETAIERIIDHLPPAITMVAATRRLPSFNLSRLRVSGDVLELGAEDLRFRSWEVDTLFRDFYGEPLLPEELAELHRRTEGWAAGLQLFHLATTGKPVSERRRVLNELGVRSRLVREYLTANVIDELPDELRRFLLDTCVLGRLTPALCDEIRGAHNSATVLAELEQRQIFTQPLDEEGAFRYHEVLRSHLESALVEQLGEDASREAYRRAGVILENASALPEALRAYCRAEDWDAATRLLGNRGEQVIEGRAGWLDAMPTGLLDHDPWLMLGVARRAAASGRWADALVNYQDAESGFGGRPPGEMARRERLALSAWIQPVFVAPADWTGLLRVASRRDPRKVQHEVAKTDGVPGLFASGVTALLAGSVKEARRLLNAAADHPDGSPVMRTAADVAAGVAGLLAGDALAETRLEGAADTADKIGFAWLGRLARVAFKLDIGREAPPAEDELVHEDEPWLTAAEQLFIGLAALRRSAPATVPLDAAVAGFRTLGAGSLEAWARAAHALAVVRGGGIDARQVALSAESFARAAGVQGALALSYLALAQAEPDRAAEHRALASSVANECGLDLTGLGGRDVRAVPGYDPLGPPAAVVGPLVGREREMGELRSFVDGAMVGAGHLVTIAGESGIGKTRLAEEVAIYASTAGARVLWGRASEGAPAFWPWAQVLRTFILSTDLAAVERDLNGDIPALSMVVPELSELLPGVTFAAPDAEEISRFSIFRAITDVVLRAAGEQPLVVLLDDLHWADASSLALLQFLARGLTGSPVLIVAAYRDRGSDATDVISVLGEITSASRLRVAGLGAEEVAELIERIAGRTPSAALTNAVTEKTAGNPFFVQETIRLLMTEGRFDDSSVVSADQLHIAAGVHDVVQRRLAGVSEQAQHVLAAAAVIGRQFPLRLLARVTGLDPVQILGLIGESVSASLVEEVWADAGRYGFSHALIQESIYDRLTTLQRASLHRRAGDALEETTGSFADRHLNELAHHFLRAAADGGDAAKAIDYAVRAGEQAVRSGAYDDAVRQCEAALALADGGDLTLESRAEVLLTLSALLAKRGAAVDVARARSLAEEAAAIARQLGLRELAGRADAAGAADATATDESSGPLPPTDAAFAARCFGRFQVAVNGDELDIAGVKPRPRSLLRLLVARGGRPVHREELVEALWPGESDAKAATRNLHVAVSTLRQLLEPGVGRGESSLLVRDGDAYRIAVPDGADVDVVAFERAAEDGRAARAAGDTTRAIACFATALTRYTGELLPEEGPAEWVLKDRERLRLDAAEISQALAELELDRGDATAAAAAGERGLQIDRYRDGLWRLVIASYEAAGDHAAAARARRAYDEVLDELGVRP